MNEESGNDIPKAASTIVHKVKVDDAYKEDALKKLRQLVDGNGVAPEDLSLKSFEGELLHFEAKTDLVIATKILEKSMPGKVKGPVSVANEAGVKEEVSKEYKKLFEDADSQRKMRDIALAREDKVFGLNDEVLQLPFWKKDYVVFEPCQFCRNTGKVRCQRCVGKGKIICNRCNGSGKTPCTHCNGSRTVQAQGGNRIQCSVCHGSGYQGCGQCQQAKKIRCRTCAAKGVTTCPKCQGSKCTSHITTVNIEAKTRFTYPKEELPEKICALIEKHGAKIREHATLKVVEVLTNTLTEKGKIEAPASEKKEMTEILCVPIHYEVALPYGHIEFEIGEKTYYTFLFGNKARLTHVSPFLDDLIKDGVRKLHDAIDGRGDTAANLKKASEYRCIRNGIVYASRFALRKAAEKLKQDFPFGLSAESLKFVITSSDRALKNISKKPRRIGLSSSAGAMLTAYLGYFATPLRSALVARYPVPELQMVFDGVVLVAGVFVGSILIQAVANGRVRAVLQDIAGDLKVPVAAKLGKTLYWNIGLGAAAFLGAIEIVRSAGLAEAPLWYLQGLHYAGLL